MLSHFCQQAKLITVFRPIMTLITAVPSKNSKSNFKIESWKLYFLENKLSLKRKLKDMGLWESRGLCVYVFITIMLQYFHLGENVSSTVKITFLTTSTFEQRLHENVFKKIIETFYSTISMILSCIGRRPVKCQLLLKFKVWQVYCLSFCPTTFIPPFMLFTKYLFLASSFVPPLKT